MICNTLPYMYTIVGTYISKHIEYVRKKITIDIMYHYFLTCNNLNKLTLNECIFCVVYLIITLNIYFIIECFSSLNLSGFHNFHIVFRFMIMWSRCCCFMRVFMHYMIFISDTTLITGISEKCIFHVLCAT